MKCVIDLLCDRGVNVHILHQRSLFPVPPYRSVSYSSYGPFWARVKNLALNRLSSQAFSNLVFILELVLVPRKVDLIVGVDREGLAGASFLSKLLRRPCVFFSFEIMFEEETSPRFKKIEKNASKAVNKWFVQDAERGSLIAKENGLELGRCMMLPLASKGIGKLSKSRLRDDLGIPKNKKVAMIMGSLSPWAMAYELIASVSTWPPDWCLIIHERYGQASSLLMNSKLGFPKFLGSKVFLSDSPVELIDAMGYLLTGVNAGLAFYRPDYLERYTGRNIQNLGMSSGKTSTFLRYGIPVIMNKIGYYSKIAQETGFGICVDDVTQLPEALEKVEGTEYSAAATRFFASRLDFSIYEDRVWGMLEEATVSNVKA